MKQLNVKKLVLLNLPYFLLGLFATNLGEAWRLAVGADASAKMLSFFSTLPVALGSWWPSLHPLDLAVGLCCGAGLRLAVYLHGKNAKKYRHNVEYGSARWGTHDDIAPYIDPVFQNNVILTQTERLTMSSRPKNPKYARNKNVLVIGGSGSGKTRFWLKPNLMQMHSSYVVTDPKGTILVECGKMLQRGAPKLGKDGKPVKDKHGKIVYEPYQIKVLNTINFKKSMHYNPFSYIHSEKDILKLVTTLIANTKGEGKAGDDFWVKAETLLYCALIGYIHYEAPVEEQNFSTLIEMINSMEVREDDEEFKNAVDLMLDELKEREPNHFAVRQYAKYKLAAGKTAKSILVSCGARLAVFDIAELREVTSYDELELDTLGDRRAAAGPCALPHRRVRQHRPDPQAGKAGRHHPKPGDFRLPGLAGTEPAQGHLQGQRRHHHRKYGFLHLPGRQGANHAQGAGGRAGQGDHRHLQHRREPGAGDFPLAQLSKIGQGADEPG